MSLPNLSIILVAGLASLLLSPAMLAQGRRSVAVGSSGSSSSSSSSSVFLYESVDTHPTFPGGDRKMYGFINANRRYPSAAYKARIEGRVLCSCIIDANGDITNIEIVKGVEPSLDREAIRLISSMPRWEPGKIDDCPVNTYCLIGVPFRL